MSAPFSAYPSKIIPSYPQALNWRVFKRPWQLRVAIMSIGDGWPNACNASRRMWHNTPFPCREGRTIQLVFLGTAAGGGFPQWNCTCRNCRAVRAASHQAVKPRTQSCAALSADGKRWFLLNASPDLRVQLADFPPLHPPQNNIRGTAIEGILLTNADLDHTLGLLLLREGTALSVHCLESTRRILACGLNLERIIESYCGIRFVTPPESFAELLCAGGSPSGLRYRVLSLPGSAPRYARAEVNAECAAYLFWDPRTGGKLLFAPALGRITREFMLLAASCDAVVWDGTFWSDTELRACLADERHAATALEMGHLPISSAPGSLPLLQELSCRHRIYTHINNTNPILLEDSAERAQLFRAGIVVACDGLELEL